jgi:hypothetical protein
MDGLIFIVGLLAGATVVGLRSRSSTTPGVVLTLALVAGSIWYVFA